MRGDLLPAGEELVQISARRATVVVRLVFSIAADMGRLPHREERGENSLYTLSCESRSQLLIERLMMVRRARKWVAV